MKKTYPKKETTVGSLGSKTGKKTWTTLSCYVLTVIENILGNKWVMVSMFSVYRYNHRDEAVFPLLALEAAKPVLSSYGRKF